jgi:hypothetical protein
VESGEAFLRIEGEKLLQEPGGLGTGPGEGRVDRSEDKRESVGLMQREQPASSLAAAGANGEQMEELLVLLRRPVHGK